MNEQRSTAYSGVRSASRASAGPPNEPSALATPARDEKKTVGILKNNSKKKELQLDPSMPLGESKYRIADMKLRQQEEFIRAQQSQLARSLNKQSIR